jgi:uncharacterized iron-regulated protein
MAEDARFTELFKELAAQTEQQMKAIQESIASQWEAYQKAITEQVENGLKAQQKSIKDLIDQPLANIEDWREAQRKAITAMTDRVEQQRKSFTDQIGQ